jgi:hypothetical protein
MTDEIVLNQNGEQTDLTVPHDFGNGLAFLNPSDMPDLENAEVGFNIQPESIEFKTVGESIRGIFNGFTTFKVKDKVNKGQYLDRKTVVLQTKHGVKINMGANLVKQFELVPVGTAVQITYQGEQRTNSGNDVKIYDVHVLNVKGVSSPRAVQSPAPQPTQSQKAEPKFTNIEHATSFWTKASELKMTHEEGLAHLAEYNNDMYAALVAL